MNARPRSTRVCCVTTRLWVPGVQESRPLCGVARHTTAGQGIALVSAVQCAAAGVSLRAKVGRLDVDGPYIALSGFVCGFGFWCGWFLAFFSTVVAGGNWLRRLHPRTGVLSVMA